MSLLISLVAAQAVPVPIEEQMEVADALLDQAANDGGSFLSQNGGWMIFIAMMVVAVAVMLIILAGRYRNRQDDYNFQEEPLFNPETDEDDFNSPFAEVVIEDDVPPGQFAQVMDDDTEEGDVQDEDETAPLAGEETVMAEEVEADEDHETPAYPKEEDAAPVHPNVVPLRTAAEDTRQFAPAYDEGEPQDTLPAEEDERVAESEELDAAEQEARPAPRYAFATGRAAAADTTYSQSTTAEEDKRSAMGQAAGTEEREEPRRYAQASHGSSGGSDDRDRPYVAPFIRDDIERAERRQSERVDRLREDFAHQFDTLKAEQSSRLDLVIAAIDRKLDSLDRRRTEMSSPSPAEPRDDTNFLRLNDEMQQISAAIDGQGQRIRAITGILETKFAELGRVYDEVKTVHEEVKFTRSEIGNTGVALGDVRTDLDEVKEHVGRLERAILDRAAQDSSTTVRLADVVRGTLPDGSYEFGAPLANGETVDCLIRFEGLRHRIAIDGSFPMEAFHELPSRDAVRRNLPQAKSAEDGFRRAILRAILEAADRCISPGETADSCLLFLPSEAAYTILHDRFPDLVRDSQRARVWLVSPSTLMGTLHLVRSLLPDGSEMARREAEMNEVRSRREEDNRLREEVEVLRRRAATLSEELERTRGTLRGLIDPLQGAPAPAASPAESSPTESAEVKWGAASNEAPERSQPAPRPSYHEAERYDDDEIIESLSFEGTPDWQSPLGRESASSSPRSNPYDPGREGPLR